MNTALDALVNGNSAVQAAKQDKEDKATHMAMVNEALSLMAKSRQANDKASALDKSGGRIARRGIDAAARSESVRAVAVKKAFSNEGVVGALWLIKDDPAEEKKFREQVLAIAHDSVHGEWLVATSDASELQAQALVYTKEADVLKEEANAFGDSARKLFEKADTFARDHGYAVPQRKK